VPCPVPLTSRRPDMSRLVLPRNRHLKGYDDDAAENDIDDSRHSGVIRDLERVVGRGCPGAPARAIDGGGVKTGRLGPMGGAGSWETRPHPSLASSAHPAGLSLSQAPCRARIDRQACRDQAPTDNPGQHADSQGRAPDHDPVGHQLQRIEDFGATDQGRSLVCGSARRILHEHTDERTATSRLRVLSPNHRSHLASTDQVQEPRSPGYSRRVSPTQRTPDAESGVPFAPL